MTLELVLLLILATVFVLAVFLGPAGPIATFKDAGPRLAARVERNLTVGNGYRVSQDNKGVNWITPNY